MSDYGDIRVLVIDDDPAICRQVRTVLKRAHAARGTPSGPDDVTSPGDAAYVEPLRNILVDTAASGAEGVRALDAAVRMGCPYSIAFIDLMMPDMDGIQTTRLMWSIAPSLLVVSFSASEEALCLAEQARITEDTRLLLLRKPLRPVELRQAVRFLAGRSHAELALRRKTVSLDERVRALNCLHAMSNLMEDTDRPLADLLADIISLIPSGFQNPERVSARIVLHGTVYAPHDFRETEWKLASPVLLDGRLAGAMEACCAAPEENDGKDPFMREDRALMDELANRLGELLARKEAEQRLQASEERHRALFENSRDAIMVFGAGGRMFNTGNPAALKLFGVHDLKQFTSLGPADMSPELQPDGRPSGAKAQEMIAQAVRDGVAFFEWRHKQLDGTEFPATVLLARFQLGDKVFVQATVRDITRQKQLQAELSQAQRLEAVGQLAAGIAHEINTPTQYIGDNTRFLSDAFEDIRPSLALLEGLAASDASPPPGLLEQLRTAALAADLAYLVREIPRAIEQSLEGVGHVSKIVRAMKEFSHPGGEGKTSIDLNRTIESTLTVCRNEWKYVADVVTDFDPALPPVPCVQAELNQAILNMVINAAHAIQEKVGESGEKGTITIRTRRNEDAVDILIEDTGAGIPEHLRQKVFDLFFTTKPVGKGTGQGLTLAQSIVVERHGGKIECQSQEGEGTIFTIRLPLALTSRSAAPPACADALAPSLPEQEDPVFTWPTQPVY
ncbi:MAG: ATP-binding protein [Patescibacteria group bacterium]|nr:ATP-binding protein [Patescibacteria group bacterium]